MGNVKTVKVRRIRRRPARTWSVAAVTLALEPGEDSLSIFCGHPLRHVDTEVAVGLAKVAVGLANSDLVVEVEMFRFRDCA